MSDLRFPTHSETNAASLFGRRERLALGVIFGIAVALRLAYLIENLSNPFLYMPVLDEAYYIGLGRSIAHGHILGENRVFFMDPLYGYFLGFLFFALHQISFLTGGPVTQETALMAARVIQIFADSSIVYLIYLLGAKTWSRDAGLFAAAVWAIYTVSFFYNLLILKTTFTVFLLLLFTLAMVQAGERGKQRNPPAEWILLGVFAGLLTFLRANLLLMAPLTIVAWILTQRPPARQVAVNSTMLCIGLLAVLTLGAARNKAAAGEWVFLNSQSGRLLYASNNPENLTGRYMVPSFSRKGPEQMDRDFHAEAERRLGRKLTAREVSSYWTGETIKFICASPAEAAFAVYNKLKGTIGSFEIPINRSLKSNERFSYIAQAPAPNFAFALALGLPGLLVGLQIRRQVWWLIPAMGTILFTVTLFYTCSRFRLPMVPFLLVGAGISATLLAGWAREGKWLPMAAMLASSLAIGAVSMSVEGREYRADEKYFLAKAYISVGDLANGAAVAMEASREYPGESRFLVLLGMAALSSNDLPAAIRINREALRLDPENGDAMNNLGLALSASGEHDEAVRWLTKAFSVNQAPMSLLGLAVALEKKGDGAAALEVYRRFVALEKPGSPRASMARGRIRALGGGE
ncbi:MAG: tetratricopeptide repeat protein [Nitrospinota bacterium]|nr:tetratricopeptide repeat protein [Nitrospinota bacterium]